MDSDESVFESGAELLIFKYTTRVSKTPLLNTYINVIAPFRLLIVPFSVTFLFVFEIRLARVHNIYPGLGFKPKTKPSMSTTDETKNCKTDSNTIQINIQTGIGETDLIDTKETKLKPL